MLLSLTGCDDFLQDVVVGPREKTYDEAERKASTSAYARGLFLYHHPLMGGSFFVIPLAVDDGTTVWKPFYSEVQRAEFATMPYTGVQQSFEMRCFR